MNHKELASELAKASAEGLDQETILNFLLEQPKSSCDLGDIALLLPSWLK